MYCRWAAIMCYTSYRPFLYPKCPNLGSSGGSMLNYWTSGSIQDRKLDQLHIQMPKECHQSSLWVYTVRCNLIQPSDWAIPVPLRRNYYLGSVVERDLETWIIHLVFPYFNGSLTPRPSAKELNPLSDIYMWAELNEFQRSRAVDVEPIHLT